MFDSTVFEIKITSFHGNRIERLSELKKLLKFKQIPDVKKVLDGSRPIKSWSKEELISVLNLLDENFSYIIEGRHAAYGTNTYGGGASFVVPDNWNGLWALDIKEKEINSNE